MKIFALLFLFAACASSIQAGEDHDIHISLCEMRYNPESSSFEVSLKIFIDDLELAIREEQKVSGLHIGTKTESSNADDYIASYLKNQFSIDMDGVRLEPQFLGKETTEDMLAVWCYVEFKVTGSTARKCAVSNRILMDIYDDQRNIMDIRMSKTHKDYTIFESGRTTWNYTF